MSFSNGSVEFTYATEKLRFVIEQAGEGRQLGIWAALQSFLRVLRSEIRREEVVELSEMAACVEGAKSLVEAQQAVLAFVERRRQKSQPDT